MSWNRSSAEGDGHDNSLETCFICFHRGSPRGHIVPPARWQEEESWLLFSRVWGPQVCSTGSPPPHEWQGQGVGEPSHCWVGWPRRWAWPGGHGQGSQVQHAPFGKTPQICSVLQGNNIQFVFTGEGALCKEAGHSSHWRASGKNVLSVWKARASEKIERLCFCSFRRKGRRSEGEFFLSSVKIFSFSCDSPCFSSGLFCLVRLWMRWTERSWEERKLKSSWQSPQTRRGKSAKQLGRPPGMQGEGRGHVTGQLFLPYRIQ